MAKRLFDLVAATIGLLLLALPLGLIALAIRLDSPGPVFFRQPRVGLGGRPFRIHKFRTMVDAPAAPGSLLTVGRDPRITRVGAWLRDRRLDELPQLIDVLAGEMSLVGPRPEVPRYVAMYSEAMKIRVLSVRPGITDPASLAFRDEAGLLAAAADPEREYVEVILPRKLALQAAYAERANWATDLGVILRSLRVLLGR
jgi:lipopolysaccharide/colanic/teichoic acid biosynthesis glycosyltransferase